MCNAVVLGDVLVKAMGYVIKFIVAQSTDKTFGLCGRREKVAPLWQGEGGGYLHLQGNSIFLIT